MNMIKTLLSKVNLYLVFLSALVVKAVISSPNMADAVIFAFFCAFFMGHKYLKHVKKADIMPGIQQDLNSLKQEIVLIKTANNIKQHERQVSSFKF